MRRPTLGLLSCLCVVATASSPSDSVRGECIPTSADHSSYHCFSNDPFLTCEDQDERCGEWAGAGECRKNPRYMLVHCPRSCDSCVGIHPGGVVQMAPSRRDEVVRRLVETQQYIGDKVASNVAYLQHCVNQDPLCTYWAVEGQCRTNSRFMIEQCAAACRVCRL